MTASVPQKSLHVVQNTEWNVCSPAEALVANNRKHQLRVMRSRGFSSAAIAPIRTLTLWLTLIPSVELSGNKFPFSPWHWLCVVTGCSIESHIMCLGTLQRCVRSRGDNSDAYIRIWFRVFICVAVMYSDSLQSTVRKWLCIHWSLYVCALTQVLKYTLTACRMFWFGKQSCFGSRMTMALNRLCNCGFAYSPLDVYIFHDLVFNWHTAWQVAVQFSPVHRWFFLLFFLTKAFDI